MKKAILYINQFFGQIGGEDQADFAPAIREEKIGPALEYAKTLHAEITHTIICGDNYMGSHTETAVNEILEMLVSHRPPIPRITRLSQEPPVPQAQSPSAEVQSVPIHFRRIQWHRTFHPA